MPGVTITPALIGLLGLLVSLGGLVATGAIAYSTIARLERSDASKQKRITGLERWAIKQGYEPPEDE